MRAVESSTKRLHVPAVVRELAIRAGVAVVALPAVGMLLWRGGAWTAALVAIAAGIAAYEYYRMTELRGEALRWIGIAAAALVAGLPLLARGWPAISLAVLAVLSLATWTWLLAHGPRPDAPRLAGHLVAGVIYIATGLGALAALRAQPGGLAWAAIVLIATWANDTGAFLGGKAVGRHRLIPQVSPGKTWEGLALGALAGIAVAVAVHGWLGIGARDALAVGGIAAVAGPTGDLCKSMMKRAAGVKDSGRLFLAHGGMLDRIDAILFTAPVVLAYVLLI